MTLSLVNLENSRLDEHIGLFNLFDKIETSYASFALNFKIDSEKFNLSSTANNSPAGNCELAKLW